MIMTVDPGINAMGFALWDPKKWRRPDEKDRKLFCPLEAFVLTPLEQTDWPKKVRSIMRQLDKKLIGTKLCRVYCEMPVLFAGEVGMAVARRGDLTHLAFSVGCIAQFAADRDNAVCDPVDVNDWIGQLPKDVTHSRVAKTLGTSVDGPAFAERVLGPRPSHHWDAIGVGLYCQGFWR